MHKFTVIGEGYLGSRTCEFFSASSIPEAEIDIRDLQNVRAVLDKYPSEVLFNLAAMTNTNALEQPQNQENGFRVNVQGLANVALACRERGIRLVHFSTGMMFDGLGPDSKGWREDDKPEPTGYYVWTKAWGDAMLQPFMERDGILIVRLHLPISGRNHPRNQLNKMLGFDKATDTESSMTVVEDLLKAVEQLIELQVCGIFNVANPGLMSFYRIAEIMKEEGLMPANKSVARLSRAELDAMGGAKQTFPLLNTDKLAATGVVIPGIEDAVRGCVRALVASC